MKALKQRGLSLIEVMVAVVISSILILGVTDLFQSSFMSGRSNSELARIQENGRLAMEVIGSDVRLAGLSTCTTNNWSASSIQDAVALDSTKKTLSLKYIDPQNCDDIGAAEQTITYTFANNGLSKAVNGNPAQPLLGDDKEPVEGSFTLLPDDSDPDTANAVQITIKVKSSQENFSAREFSSTYEFKNRLIVRD
ncbi:prepilin-type N-terminal cleavage/methylation domain-containing protein [Pseudomonas sp. AA-38]|uniref:PilW family protein n=1 Tax=Pseudomonas sp. AA-38 TaxID=3028807 RepID=UPI0023F9E175|nr:prepilin-type N-terminal cleavage/methylation domain-containing protein [Pseudomonas sp. AA-38]